MMTVLVALFSLHVHAYDFEVDGIYYNILSLAEPFTCEVTKGGYSGDISIPAYVSYKNRSFKVIGIGAEAFAKRSTLTSISFPNTVTYIGSGAFEGCNLVGTKFEIPQSVTTIESRAFNNCHFDDLIIPSLPNLDLSVYASIKANVITLPSTIQKLDGLTGISCYELILPSSVTEIDSYVGFVKKLRIPKTVKKILDDNGKLYVPYVFNCDTLIIEDGDENLEIGSFYTYNGSFTYRKGGCIQNFSYVYIGRNTNISNLFYDSKSTDNRNEASWTYNQQKHVKTIEVGRKCTDFTIPLYTWYGGDVIDKYPPLPILKKIVLHNITPPTLSAYFTKKQYMEDVQILVPKGTIKAYQSAEGWKNFWNIEEYDDVTAPIQSYTLTYIVDGETYKTYKKEEGATITPEAAPLKDGYTFSGWSGIPTTMPAKDVTVTGTFTANTVEYVDKASVEIDGIFYRLSAKSRSAEVIAGATKYAGAVTIPATVQLNGAPYSVTSIGTIAFKDCSALTSVKIPEGITSIGIGAFTACTSLSSVSLPNSITEIGNSVFWGCKGLESIKIPSSVTTIGEFAFVDAGLTSLTIPSSVQSIQQHAFQGCKGLTNVTIPGNVVSIDEYAFCGCDNLSSITLENGVTNIGERVFMSCGNLETVVLPNSLEVIGPYAFAGCNQMRTMDMPNSVTTLGDGAFLQCANLETVKLSAGIKTMGTYIFQKCYNLNSVIIPGIKTLTEGMFMNCSNLIQVEMTEGVESLGLGVFYHCTNLPSITIPQSVKSIGQRVFEGCENLTSVTVLSNTPATLTSSSFENASKSVLYVPKGSQNTYQSAAYWKNFALIVEPYYILTYMIDDEVYKTVNVNYGESITPEAEPTKEGYTFSGWGEIPAKMPAEDVTIIGSFTLVDAIEDVLVDDEKYQIYIPNGTPVDTLQKGVNILYYSNGSIKKVYIK